jgi:hypothetical protein
MYTTCHYKKDHTEMHTSIRFKDIRHVEQMRQFVFGEYGVQPRLEFLKTATETGTTVDVLTSGSAIDVTRTIELLGLRDYFDGVHQHCKTNSEVASYFDGTYVHSTTARFRTKGNIIKKILREKYDDDRSNTVFLDDTFENGTDCHEHVEFVHVKNTEHTAVFPTENTVGRAMEDWLALPDIKQIIHPAQTTATTGIRTETFQLLIERMTAGEIQHIFIDWDDCFQILCAPYPLEFPTQASQQYAGAPELFYKIPEDRFVRWLPQFLTENGFEVVVVYAKTSLLKGFDAYK